MTNVPMAEVPIPVMVVEDEPRTRAALCQDLETCGRFQVVAQADTAEAAVRLARDAKPAIILIDLRLRHGSSIEAIRQIRRAQPDIRLLVVSVAPLPDIAVAIRAGAHGYVDKYAGPEKLIGAVLAVRTGTHLAPALAEHVLAAVQCEDARRTLTAQQLEVLRYVAHGYYNDHIAKRLGIEKRTVNRHLENIREKLGVHRRGDLGQIGRDWGLEPPDPDDQRREPG